MPTEMEMVTPERAKGPKGKAKELAYQTTSQVLRRSLEQ